MVGNKKRNWKKRDNLKPFETDPKMDNEICLHDTKIFFSKIYNYECPNNKT